MRDNPGWLRRRRLVWLYAVIVPLWTILTDYGYESWTHQLNFQFVVFISVRSSLLYALTVWSLHGLSRRWQRAEQRYETFVQASPQALFVEENDKVVYANPAALSLAGARRASDVLSNPIVHLFGPTHVLEVAAAQEADSAHPDGSESHGLPLDARLVRLDGRILDVEIIVTPIEVDGRLARQILCTDVTEKRRMEHDLMTAVTELEAFIEYNTDAIGIYTVSGHLTKANAKWEKLYGISRREWMGRHIFDLPCIPQELRIETRELIDSLSQGQIITGFRTVRHTQKKAPFPVSLSMFPIRNDVGEIAGWSEMIREISVELEAEQRLLESEKLAAVGQLAAGVAHEIRNPLTAVRGFLQILPSSSPEKMYEYAGIMTSELDRITAIVAEMLALAKPQAEEFTHVDVACLISHVYSVLEPEARMRNVVMAIEHLDAAASMMGQENRLKQVLINLVRNAMDALDEEPRCITLEARAHDNTVRIIIKDSGVGIPEGQLYRLGEPFFTTKEHGTGLGLHVCRQIVEQHAGTMEFESRVGEGTTVFLTFAHR